MLYNRYMMSMLQMVELCRQKVILTQSYQWEYLLWSVPLKRTNWGPNVPALLTSYIWFRYKDSVVQDV